jgi:hypothetical protein
MPLLVDLISTTYYCVNFSWLFCKIGLIIPTFHSSGTQCQVRLQIWEHFMFSEMRGRLISSDTSHVWQILKMERLSFCFVLMWLGFELKASHFQTGALPLEPYLQSILLWLFWKWGPHELFAWAGLKPQSSQVIRITGISHWHLMWRGCLPVHSTFQC